jgi:hypothetical protein
MLASNMALTLPVAYRLVMKAEWSTHIGDERFVFAEASNGQIALLDSATRTHLVTPVTKRKSSVR